VAPPKRPITVIPARLASTRLPRKPLAEIAGAPMIVWVWRRAIEADTGPVVVACADAEIADAIRAVGGHAVMTRPDHASGSDRVFEAVEAVDPGGAHDAVINVQGDLPTIHPAAIRAVLRALARDGADMATLAAPIVDPAERADPNVVKAVIALGEGARAGRALYFSRQAVPAGDGPLYHHIGLYGFRRAALRRFVGLAPSGLERRERLEQLRALEDGMRIDVALVDTVPLGVDTPADLARARGILGSPDPANSSNDA
jgi:3-deoxy-manno-octulosonate cytidylyltransferase (CMP-KDO synthetase)